MAITLANPATLGGTIREARIRQGFGLRDLARKLASTPSWLADIENDRRVPTDDVLQAIALELDLSLDELSAASSRTARISRGS